VEVLGKRLGADEAYGTLLEERGGRLTGRVLGNRHSPHGKLEVLSEVLTRDGLVWDDTTVVVDDRSNAEIVAAAGTSIGVNPELPVLKDAQFVMPCVDLTEVLDFVPGSTTSQAAARSRELTHELVRKAVHICGVAVPALAAWSKPFTLILIAVVTGLYALSEALRQLGLALPPVSTITRWAMRKAEARGVVKGPILYGAGIWLTVALFGHAPATAGVLTFAVGDGAASLVGSSIGRIPLPHSRGKTLEGSLAVLLAGVFIAIFFVSWPWAIAVGVVASLVESLPIGDFDNLFLPLACAGVVVLARRVG
jgi:dolichol kinase